MAKPEQKPGEGSCKRIMHDVDDQGYHAFSAQICIVSTVASKERKEKVGFDRRGPHSSKSSMS